MVSQATSIVFPVMLIYEAHKISPSHRLDIPWYVYNIKCQLLTLNRANIRNMYINYRHSFVYVGILHQNFRLFLTLSLPHTIIEEASRYNLVFVP